MYSQSQHYWPYNWKFRDLRLVHLSYTTSMPTDLFYTLYMYVHVHVSVYVYISMCTFVCLLQYFHAIELLIWHKFNVQCTMYMKAFCWCDLKDINSTTVLYAVHVHVHCIKLTNWLVLCVQYMYRCVTYCTRCIRCKIKVLLVYC